MKNILLVVAIAMGLSCFAQQKKTENIVIVTLDGFRWQDMFRGADSAILNKKQFAMQDSTALFNKYWADDRDERRQKLMPFFWNKLIKAGQLYGNRDDGSYVNVTNRYWFSYPGYNEIFTGYGDTLINSNDFGLNPNKNVLEFINQQPGFENKVKVFGSWKAFTRILNVQRSKLDVTVGLADTAETRQAIAYMQQAKPRVLYINMSATDHEAHDKHYDSYLDAAHREDSLIGAIWKFIQHNRFYKNRTTLFVTVDHGRGDAAKFTTHNAKTPHSNEIWFAAIGPDTKPLGEMKQGRFYQNQFAKTIAAFLGLDFTSDHPVGEKINAPLMD